MLKQMIGCPRSNFSARISQPLSLVLFPLLSIQFAYSPNAQASPGRPSLVQEARYKSIPKAAANAVGLPAARPELSCAPYVVATAPGADSPATPVVHRSPRTIKGKTLALNTQEPTTLESGKPVERELSGGQEHIYQIALTDGQYASVVIEQHGIDVAVQLQERDGKVTTNFDSEYRGQGEEKAEIVAEATGSYRLKVQASSKSAPTARYVIRVGEIRPATRNDLLMHEARKLESAYRQAVLAGKYEEARGLAERALAVSESVVGTEHPFVADQVFHLAHLSKAKQDFAKSESLHERALAISEKTLGPEHAKTIEISRSLAFLYFEANELAKAERLSERAVEMSQKTLGPEHRLVAGCLLTLAQITRDPQKKEQILQRSLMIAKKTVGNEHSITAEVLNELGILYMEKRDFNRAEPFLLRAQAAYEKSVGPEHLGRVVSLFNLGIIARERKDYAKAEEDYSQAMAIVEKIFGPENPRLSMILNSIAIIYRARGEYQKSLEALLRGLRISERTRGPYHPLTLQSLGNIARTYAAQGNLVEAVRFQSRVDEVIERNIEMNLAIGSERQKMSYLNSMAERMDRTISLNANLLPNDPAASALAALVLLQRKGRVLDATSASFAALRQRSTVEEQALIQQYNETTAQLARLVLNGPQKSSFEEHQKKVSELEERKERLEAEISRRSAEFRASSRPVTLAAIQEAIPASAALIEFAVYRPFDPKAETNSEAYKEPRYIAYVIRHRSEVRWAELGPAKEIDEMVDALRQALRDPLRKDVRQLARAVDEKLMRPVRSLAGDAKHWLISPDGKLNLIPFEALVDEQNRYLLERYAFAYLTSGRDLLRLQTPRESKSSPVVFADPIFGDPALIASTDASANANAASRAQFNYSQIFFGPLPGVGDEVRALKTLLPQATFLTRDQATEATLKRVRAPSILHIATHGFFLENDSSVENRSLTKTPDGTRLGKWVARVDNPLLRSGLALAGANQGRSGDDDGVLTALEATALDLWGTKLVVLSACDTGVGEVKNGDGVYGLRRALFLAGTESQLMSLWPVSDRSTRDLMAGYYQALTQDAGRGEALRRVQLKMLRNKSRSHPYYWASFIMAGEWANLKGQR